MQTAPHLTSDTGVGYRPGLMPALSSGQISLADLVDWRTSPAPRALSLGRDPNEGMTLAYPRSPRSVNRDAFEVALH
jgi:hypothetical protein